MNHVERLAQLGQSYWLEEAAEASDLTEEAVQQAVSLGYSGVAGCRLLTPEALHAGEIYDEAIISLIEDRRGIDAGGICEQLMLQDCCTLADLWADEYATSGHSPGLVAVPILPLGLDDPAQIRAEARRIAKSMNRRNIVVKIPSGPATVAAISDLVADNVSIYITNLRDRERVSQVLDAYREGLEYRAEKGLPLDGIQCLAGVNISGIDQAVDCLLDESIEFETNLELQIELEQKKGRTAIATARLAAAAVAQRSRSAQWNILQRQRANPLQMVWENLRETQACTTASYFKSLIGSNTICCLPLDALQDLAADTEATVSLHQGYSQAQMLFSRLAQLGIDLHQKMDDEDYLQAEDELERFLTVLETISERRASPSLST